MIQSILVYTFIILVMLFLAISVRNKSIRYANFSVTASPKTKFWYPEVIFMILFFSVMFGMRYKVGTDHLSYLHMYIYGDSNLFRFEPLFRIITTICSNFNTHPIIYFSIWAFIQITFFLLAFKNELYLFPSLIFFLFFNGEFMFWMNGIRQALAMCIWIYSIRYIYTKKLWHYLFWGIIAFLFHKSAIILVVFYPILKNGRDYFKSIPLQLVLFVLAIVIRNVFDTFILQFESVVTQFQNLISGYEAYSMDKMLDELDNDVGGSGLAFLYKSVVWIVIILYSKRLKSFYCSNKFNVIYFLFFIGVLAEYAIPSGAIVFYRPFRYFIIFKTVILAYFLYYLFRDNKLKYNKLLAYTLIISFVGIFYLNQITLPEDNSAWFKFYFQEM